MTDDSLGNPPQHIYTDNSAVIANAQKRIDALEAENAELREELEDRSNEITRVRECLEASIDVNDATCVAEDRMRELQDLRAKLADIERRAEKSVEHCQNCGEARP